MAPMVHSHPNRTISTSYIKKFLALGVRRLYSDQPQAREIHQASFKRMLESFMDSRITQRAQQLEDSFERFEGVLDDPLIRSSIRLFGILQCFYVAVPG